MSLALIISARLDGLIMKKQSGSARHPFDPGQRTYLLPVHAPSHDGDSVGG